MRWQLFYICALWVVLASSRVLDPRDSTITGQPPTMGDSSITLEPITSDETSSTNDPSVTLEPITTEEPSSTNDPSVTSPSITTDDSSSTVDPNVTSAPSTTDEPNSTNDPSVTIEPITTDEPSSTNDPSVTLEPITTDEPSPTNDPSVTSAPNTTDEPSSTNDPSVTLEPITTDEPISTNDPSVTLDPITTNDPSFTDDSSVTSTPITTNDPTPITTTMMPIVKPEQTQPIVTIPQGTVVGSVAFDGDYYEFHGIPYADSTSGAHRFKSPLPPPTFQDTFIASRKDIKCVRALGTGYEGTEDCLVANIFTPTIDHTSNLPVMVWIKGKEFDKIYEHELSFKNFMEKDVVVVSLNYRESILGFLCLGTETAPGNAGLKDIIAGLRWVKENIRQFGGNSNDITLFGHGSGAAAVDLVTLSPMANGLVNKAIAQSGNAMSPWAVSRDNLEYAVQVAQALGHVVTNIQELSKIFERTSVAALMGVINELDLTDNALAFAPCIERQDLAGVQPFLHKTPLEIISNGEFLRIPFITGFVDNEGTIRAEEALRNDWLDRMEDSFSEFLQPDLKFESNKERSEVAKQIKEFYFGNESIDFSTIGDYIAYHGETMILVSSIREMRARAQASSSPTYLYQFSYKGVLGEPFMGPVEVETAAHSEELAYMLHVTPEETSDLDLIVGEILVERWTNFAKTGTPSSEISRIIWQPFTTDRDYYLRVLASDEINTAEAIFEVVLRKPHPETITFWDKIYKDHFQDAESNWSLTERDDDDDLIDGSGGEGSGEEGSGGEGSGGEGSGEEGSGGEGSGGEGSGEEGSGGEGSGEEGSGGEGSGEEGSGGEGSGEEGSGDGGSGGGAIDDNSAATTVGCTFLIITVFTLLNKFHSSQLMS